MPPPIDPDKRQQIVAAIQAGGGCNAIARLFDVAPSTVSKIASDDGMFDAFDRSETKRATEARKVDLAAWRTEFAQRVAQRAEWLESRMDDEQPQVVVTKDGPAVVQTGLTARDARDYMTAIGIAVDKVGVLTRDDSEGLAAVDAWLRSVTGVEVTR